MNSFIFILAELSEAEISGIVAGCVTLIGAIAAFLQKNKILEYLERRRKDKMAIKKDKRDKSLLKYALKTGGLKGETAGEVIKEEIKS